MDLKTAIAILQLQDCQDLSAMKLIFRELAHRYHPDKNSSTLAREHFEKIVAAYEYCVTHFSELQDFWQERNVDVSALTQGFALENFHAVFHEIFSLNTTTAKLGYREPTSIHLNLWELCHGGWREEVVATEQSCTMCVGSGMKQGLFNPLCRYCFGQGCVQSTIAKQKMLCPKCAGRGRMPVHPCAQCDGYGATPIKHRQKFFLPKGLTHRQTLHLAGLDLATQQKTELFLQIVFAGDKVFQLDKHNLICRVPIDFKKAQFWLHDHKVETPMGQCTFRVSPKAKPLDRMVLFGQGLFQTADANARGDLVVILSEKKNFWQRWLEKINFII